MIGFLKDEDNERVSKVVNIHSKDEENAKEDFDSKAGVIRSFIEPLVTYISLDNLFRFTFSFADSKLSRSISVAIVRKPHAFAPSIARMQDAPVPISIPIGLSNINVVLKDAKRSCTCNM